MAAVERTYTVPLRRGFWKTPRYKRTNKAMRTLREFLVRHMKVPDGQIKVGQHLNLFLWKHGIKNPPAKVQITVTKSDEGIVQAELAGKKFLATITPEERQEAPQSMKEKLQAAIGGKKGEEEKKENEKSPETPEKKEEKPSK